MSALSVALGASAFSSTIDQQLALTFEQFAELLRSHWHVGKLPHGWSNGEAVKQDKNTRWFCLARFREPVRNGENVGSVSGFVGDFDDGATWTPETIASLMLVGIKHLNYSTYSHSSGRPKYRLVIPYSAPISVTDHNRMWQHFNTVFCGALDGNAKDAPHLFYFPSCCADTTALARWHIGDGELLDPATVLAALPPAPPDEEPAGAGEWTDEPVSGWRGPADDDQLIALMLERNHQVQGVNFRALWSADADVLARRWRAQNDYDAFDHSAADASLFARLAHYTGSNCERVERLARRSGLCAARAGANKPFKWDSPWLRSEILKACARCDSWLNAPDPKEIFGYASIVPAATNTAPAADSLGTVVLLASEIPKSMEVNGKGRAEASLPNLIGTLSAQTRWRIGFDTFRDRIMIAAVGSDAWRPILDEDMVGMRSQMQHALRFAPIGKDLMQDALLFVAKRYQFDSAQVWLSGLIWDGVSRAGRFLADYCGAPDDDYSRAVSRYIWSGMAARVHEPGCQLDMVVALYSSQQGLYKSTALQCLAPDPDFFTDGLNLQHDNADLKRLLRGKLVIEIAEMAGVSKADVEDIKRAITRRREEWIEKWQTQPTVYLRRCMLFATTNNEQFLPKDDSGQRRWLPNEIQRIDRERVAADRNQLWAEGAAIYRARLECNLPGVEFEAAEQLAKGRHARHEQTDVWATTIEQWLVTPTFGPNDQSLPPPCTRPFTIAEVLQGALLFDKSRMDAKAEKRVAAVLKQLGYQHRTVRDGDKFPKRWVRV